VKGKKGAAHGYLGQSRSIPARGPVGGKLGGTAGKSFLVFPVIRYWPQTLSSEGEADAWGWKRSDFPGIAVWVGVDEPELVAVH